MKDNFAKFMFLAAVVAVVLFSRFNYPSASSANSAGTASTSTAADLANVPIFVMPSVSASNGTSATSSQPPVTAESSANFNKVGNAAPPVLNVNASLVADLQTGTVFEGLNQDSRWPTASITKLMTATIAMDDLDPSAKITITQQMFAVDPQDEETLVIGGTYTVADLLRVLLLPSSNVAAEALADLYGRTAFLAEMNARAEEWGMTNTYFADPSGLSASNQSTASDFLKLAQVVYNKYPEIFAITRTPQVLITEQNTGKLVTVKSINNFAGQADFIGGKTGYTDQADQNLLSVFNYEGHPLFIVVLGSNDRFGDTQKLYTWFKANFK